MKKIIHVNQQVIARNRKTGANDPPLICRTYKGSHVGTGMSWNGETHLINSPHHPLPCGARVWLETHAEVFIIDQSDEEKGSTWKVIR
jgi:hypothetical protein